MVKKHKRSSWCRAKTHILVTARIRHKQAMWLVSKWKAPRSALISCTSTWQTCYLQSAWEMRRSRSCAQFSLHDSSQKNLATQSDRRMNMHLKEVRRIHLIRLRQVLPMSLKVTSAALQVNQISGKCNELKALRSSPCMRAEVYGSEVRFQKTSSAIHMGTKKWRSR